MKALFWWLIVFVLFTFGCASPAHAQDESRITPFTRAAIYTYMAAASIDSVQTANCLAYPACREGNPFVAYFTDNWGPVRALSTGVALSTIMGAIALHYAPKAPKRWLIAAGVMSAWHIYIIHHNARTLREVR